ncbi:AMIN domain-containing protein [Leptolyngbya sp. PCC 6406]|uniref:AMIN domain-containing protein n=1 Tax=Leptolyngbya sp. PCC 6406 TaxID=1173264 RepID=UPI0002ACD2FE|nr:AMIN domain-containing protein [Leptolyngbya sp. PCC 6406]
MYPHPWAKTTRYGLIVDLPWMLGMAGAIAAVTLTLPAQGAVLENWSFDPDSRQLVLTLPSNITPTYFLLAEPARIVLTIPNTQLGNVPLSRYYSGAIRGIRVSQFDGNTTRIVVELAPNTVLDPRHAELSSTSVPSGNRWVLRPLVADAGATVATAPPTATTPIPPPPAIPSSTPPTPVSPPPSASPGPTAIAPLGESVTIAPDPTPSPVTVPDTASSITPDPIEIPVIPPAAAPPVTAPATTTPPTAAVPPTAPTTVAPASPERPASPSPVTSTPAPASSGVSPALPGLPETGTAVAVGAAQSPIAPAYTADDGIRTDASALLGSATPMDQPPEALPIAPFGSSGQPIVTVPTLDSSAPPSSNPPQVVVPPISTVPVAPAAPVPATPPSAVPAPTSPIPERPSTLAVPPPTAPPAVEPLTSPQSPVRPSPAVTSAPESPPASPVAAPELEPSPPASPTTVAPLSSSPPFLEGTGTTPPAPPPRPAPSGDATENTIPFGAPLPSQVRVAPAPEAGLEAGLPLGTRLQLRYPGSSPLVLDRPDPWYEVLIVAEDVRHPTTGVVLVAEGTPVLGRFEGNNRRGQRFVSQVILQGDNREPLSATSPTLPGTPQGGGNLLTNTGIGAAAITVLSGFSGVGLLGGAVLGAATGYATGPQIVTIQPGQIIEAEVIAPSPPAP